MGIRRTKQEKIEAQLKRNEVSYSFSTNSTQQVPVAHEQQVKSTQGQNLFGYPSHLIYKDILKSILVTIVIIVCLGVIYWQLK